MSAFFLGESVVVSTDVYYRGTVTKISRRYLTVRSEHRSWEFDKETRSFRGDHCGYIPHLYKTAEHEHLEAWQALYDAWKVVPHLGAGVPTEVLRTALAALLACKVEK